MNRRSSAGSHQYKNRILLPQKLRHFFSSFPDACEFPALPDWLLRRPMGSVWCVPKLPTNRHSRSGGGRNRIEPTLESNYRGKKVRQSRSKSKVADLTYKNTWSSFLKSAQSDRVTFFPSKSPPLPRSASVRFDRSWDDAVLDTHLMPSENMTAWRKPHHSSSPVRRRSSLSSAAKMDPRKYSRIESKAMREAWLNEDVFPTFGIYGSEMRNVPNMRIIDPDGLLDRLPHRKSEPSRYVMNKFVLESPGRMPKSPYYQPSPHSGRKADSLDANVSYGTSDTFLTPDSMEVHGTSTLPTTSAEQSLSVNATSSATASFESTEMARYPRPCPRNKLSSDSLDMTSVQVHNSSDTSQSIEVQVSSTLTNSSSTNTSMAAHISSGSSADLNGPKMSSYYTNDLARELLLKERAISSANSRKSCLKEKKKPRLASFKDPCRFDWTKRYLYTLAPRRTYYEIPRSTSMSRVSSSSRDYQVYTLLQQRPWQSSPDLRAGKLNSLLLNESVDLADLLQKKKKQFLTELFSDGHFDDNPLKSWKKEMQSLTLLRSASLPRCLSAGPSTEQALVLLEDDDSRFRKDRCSSSTKLTDCAHKSQDFFDGTGRELEHAKKKPHDSTASTASARQSLPFYGDNLSRTIKNESFRSEDEKTFNSFSLATPTKTKSSRKSRSPDRRPASSVKFDPLASFNAPLQPASGENKASVLRRTLNRKKFEEQQMQNLQNQEKERERRQRLRALRMDPAWSQVRGADQALEDIEHRRCFKEVVERERLLQYFMDRDEMMARVWQMPPLFERQRSTSAIQRKKTDPQLVESMDKISKIYTPMKPASKKKQANPQGLQVKGSRVGSATRDPRRYNANTDDCYLANESLQLSRPSTAKSTSTKSCHQRNV